MRDRTRLFLLVMLTVTISNLLLFCLMYAQTHKAIFQEIQSTAVSIVSTGATFLDAYSGRFRPAFRFDCDRDSEMIATGIPTLIRPRFRSNPTG